MSNKEVCINLLNSIDESQLENVAAMLKSFIRAIEEAADDHFCMKLIEAHERDNDPQNHETISFETAIREAGFSIADLQS